MKWGGGGGGGMQTSDSSVTNVKSLRRTMGERKCVSSKIVRAGGHYRDSSGEQERKCVFSEGKHQLGQRK